MTNSLLRYKKKQKYIVFDFETEGLNLRYSKPWQLGFIVTEGSRVKLEYDFHIDFPDLDISEDAKRITHFSQSIHDQKKQKKEKVLDFFDKYLYNPDYLLIGHNVLGFDVYIHNVLRLACGKPSDYSYMDRILDTNCLAKAYKMGLKHPDGNLTLWQCKLNNYIQKGMKTNQQALLREFDIEFEPDKLHDAVYDVKMTLEIFHKLIWNVEV
jgi:DNA polymerase III alpha subunit (gram-positive type)